MEPSLVKYLISILLIGLGLFYFFKPEKSTKFLKYPIKYIKISGIILVALGIYYILVMVKLLPMIEIWN